MESLEEVLREKFNKSPEEVADIKNYVNKRLDEGIPATEVFVELFGFDIEYMIEVLGGTDSSDSQYIDR